MNKLLCIFLYVLMSFTKNSNITNIDTNTYFTLDIPKINLVKDVYKYSSSKNNVNKGIYMVNNYDLNTLKGSLILASHSGNSEISYFKNLHQLNKNDEVIIKYNGYNYYYKITNKFKINKNGKFKYKDKDKTIYLVTCDKKNKDKQIVFYGIYHKKVVFY